MMLKVRDDRGRDLIFGSAPKRVVSLVPSDTLTVADLGCGGALIGRTDYCELPADLVAKLPSVGGTKNARFDAIMDLSPDLVIANQEENTRGTLEKLVQAGIRVYVAFPKRVADGLAHMAKLARIFGVDKDPGARDLVKRGYQAVREAEQSKSTRRHLSVFCPIWMSPLMTINGSTFISDMLELAGGRNAFADRERRYPLAADLGRGAIATDDEAAGKDVRYPRVTLEEVSARVPDLVLLPDEPHPFTEEDAAVFRALEIPAARVIKRSGGDLRDGVVRTGGKDLCWYGSRSVEALPRVRSLIDSLRVYS